MANEISSQLSVTINSVDTPIHPETEAEQISDFSTTIRSLLSTSSGSGMSSNQMFSRPSLMTSNKTSITIPATTAVLINGVVYTASEDKTINIPASITAANRKGKDLYVYAVQSNTPEAVFVISDNSTVPDGYTAETSRKIGGFHCLCADVGTISNHKLTGYKAGDILPASIWDLQHRPVSEPEGMVYDGRLNKWIDIYLASWNGSKLVSEYGQTVADGASSVKFHWNNFTDAFAKVKKRLPWQHEFMIFSLGSNQETNVINSADKGTTGGFTDTEGRRMISDIGCEDCCGMMWQFGLDTGNWTTQTTVDSWVNCYDDNEINSVGGQTYNQKPPHGTGIIRVILGGYWSDGAYCGSRSSRWHYGPLYLLSYCGGRGLSEPKY